MLVNRFVRTAGVLAVGVGLAVVGTGVVAGTAGATGATAAPFTIDVNGANSTATTTSPTSTLRVAGLPDSATGTVVFDQAGTPLCTATLPSRSCTTGSLAPGNYPDVTGTYSGDSAFSGSTSTNSVDLIVLAGGGPTTSCSKVSGFVTKKITFSYCQVSQRGAHIIGTDVWTGGSLTWNASKTVTTYTGSATSPGQGVCHTGSTEEVFTGTVTSDGSTFATVGGAVSYDVCESAKGVLKLVPGTKATF